MLNLLMGRGVSIVAMITAALLALWGWGYSQQYKGVTKERARQQIEGAKLNAKARKAGARARANPGRVLEKYYRD